MHLPINISKKLIFKKPRKHQAIEKEEVFQYSDAFVIQFKIQLPHFNVTGFTQIHSTEFIDRLNAYYFDP